MANELNAGSLLNFDTIDVEGDFSMAKEIEIALAALIGPLPSAPEKLVNDRRVLFVAIATGVINHLKNKQVAV
jgi:hypothetical protein